MSLTKPEIFALYRKRAPGYDRAMWIYRAFGFRMDYYRKQTVRSLGLAPGDTVVDLGCGTGLNFPLIEAPIGEQGRIIAVDLTDAMLAAARHRAKRAGWNNVQCVQADLAEYSLPGNVNGVLSTFALTLVPEYDAVVGRAAKALRPGGRVAILDFKKPEGWPETLVRFAAWLNRPFGVSLDLAVRHPWESVRRHLREMTFREFYLGALYLSVGEAPDRHGSMPGERPDLGGSQTSP